MGGSFPHYIIMIENILIHAVNVIVGIALATLWQKHKAQKEEQDAIKMGLQSLLRGEITKAYYLYMDKGWIPLYALQSIEANYKNYEALGANGVIDKLWKELMELPHTNLNDDKREVKK